MANVMQETAFSRWRASQKRPDDFVHFPSVTHGKHSENQITERYKSC